MNPAGVAHANTKEKSEGKRIEEFENGMIRYLGPNEEAQVVNPQRPGPTFDSFTEKILRFIGAGLGMPYELIIKDFSKTNYSSARAALNEAWKFLKCHQRWLSEKICQPVWELVAEEAFLRSYVTAPNFYQKKIFYNRARWIPPSRGYVDPEKEINASITAMDHGLSTLSDECAANGKDWQDVLRQQKKEEDFRSKIGLKPRPSLAAKGGAAAAPEKDTNENDKGDGQDDEQQEEQYGKQ